MQLSVRLRAVSGLVTPGSRLADVGTDHGYIPIALVGEGQSPGAIAMDVNPGPLRRAEENIRRYGLEGRIKTRLSDGLAALRPGEADSIVIAGMGGALTVRILEAGRGALGDCRELVLQPQSEIPKVRAFLEREGYEIAAEDLVLEEGKYYPMMRAVRQRAAAGENPFPAAAGLSRGIAGREVLDREMTWELAESPALSPKRMTGAELWYGPVLIREGHPLLGSYLDREEEKTRRVLASLEKKGTETARSRCRELTEELERIGLARAGWKLAGISGSQGKWPGDQGKERSGG